MMTWSAAVWGALGVAALPCVLGAAGLRVVLTGSVPPGLYETRELLGAPQRGQYVCVEARAATAPEVLRFGHDGFAVLLKRVDGVPGDRIEQTSTGLIAVNGRPLALSKRLVADSEGAPLPHPALPVTLGAGQVWLMSEHARGFDSRYFGPISIAALSCVGEPLWTW